MSKIRKEEGESGRLHIESPLMGESLVSKEFLRRTEAKEYFRMQPEINVIKIGGQSIIDRGKTAVLPVLDVLVQAKEKYKIILMTGGGTRARHVYSIGVDLGMPTGVLAELTSKISEQNAMMLATLMASYKAKRIHTSDLLEIPTLLGMGALPITHGTPPYGLYEHPSERTNGGIPPHRTDTGAFL
ncbi:MAG: uridine kinase, partial [Desulfobacteraceae bacterium]|nr:uridine kinase [Desulfobacteraceae bacterium]